MPKLSIIIPIYNVEKYLDKCVQSAMNQTLRDIEIILVDDESPDNCPQLCDEYAKNDSRIKVVHRKNGGLGFARNSGLEVAKGEYVTFLDSDDFVDLCTYQHLYNLVTRYNLDALYYKFKRFNTENDVQESAPVNEITEYKNEEVKELMLDIISSAPFEKLDHKVQCSSCTAIYRLDLINKYHIRFHSERELISEDLIFNLDYLTYVNRAAFNASDLYHYRFNNVSLTSKIRKDRIEKNLILYNYINSNISRWGIKAGGSERNKRLFIGNSRSSIRRMLNSETEGKNIWLQEVLDYPIWKELYVNYNWNLLPLYPKLFFYLCCKKYFRGLFLLSWIKK